MREALLAGVLFGIGQVLGERVLGLLLMAWRDWHEREWFRTEGR